SDSNDDIAAGVASSLGAWQYRDAGDALLATLEDNSRSFKVRSAAAIALGKMKQTKYLSTLDALAADANIETRYPAVLGLVEADMDNAKLAVADLLAADPGNADSVALVSGFTRKRRGDVHLASALAGVRIHPKVMSAVATYHRQTGQLPKRLRELFLETTPNSLSALLLQEDPDALVNDVDRFGNAARGERIYRRNEVACMSCHGIGSVGPTLGPNLVAVGSAADTSYMVESILKPSASISEGYENLLFILKDGTMRMGVIAFENE
ncbi:MAG: c-type cytochrome, partial [Opitutae bacterium]|nr:c-type cytochrome [Opitutae bacterium]